MQITSRTKKDFPIFDAHPDLVYLDSAATSQKPKTVIEAEKSFYETSCANVHRGLYKLSEQATEKYEKAREITAKFIKAKPAEIIFTKGATESLNIAALGFGKQFLKDGDELILTLLEHHSNIVPWQIAAKRHGFSIKYWDVTDDGKLNENEFSKLLSKKTKLLSLTHISNAIGTINPLKQIIQKAHAANLKVVVDACQSAPHINIDVTDIDADFLAFSGHKMLGPTGIGVLYGKEKLLEQMEPFFFGGDMIREVRKTGSTWNGLPWKFEAGTPNIAGAIGLGAAVEYLRKIELAEIRDHEKNLLRYVLKKLKELPFVKIYGPLDPEIQTCVISFTMDKVHPHDIAGFLDQENIAVRAGHHCCMPLMERFKIPATTRASFYLYNTEEDVDKLADALKKVYKIFA